MSHPRIIKDRVWCPFCNDYGKLMKLQSAAKLVDVHPRTIRRYIEAGRVYAIRLAGKHYRVCSGCLLRSDTRP